MPPRDNLLLLTTVFAATVAALAVVATPPPPLKWRSVAPGVWRAQVGSRDRLTLLSAAEAVPLKEALGRMPAVEAPPVDLARTGSERVENRAVARIPLLPDEKLYGLGLQMHGSNRRGGVYH